MNMRIQSQEVGQSTSLRAHRRQEATSEQKLTQLQSFGLSLQHATARVAAMQAAGFVK